MKSWANVDKNESEIPNATEGRRAKPGVSVTLLFPLLMAVMQHKREKLLHVAGLSMTCHGQRGSSHFWAFHLSLWWNRPRQTGKQMPKWKYISCMCLFSLAKTNGACQQNLKALHFS